MAAEEDDSSLNPPPQHPVPQLQGPFEESMKESLHELDNGEGKADSLERRRLLLQRDKYERVCAGRWKQRPGEKYHPLWKLSAQISFGIHLLAQGMAKSEEEVMRILQSHVDDIDGFLERTTEDLEVAQADVDDRLECLRLPMQHFDVFDQMLEDKAFRISIVDGNEMIEHVVERTAEALNDSIKDVQKGIDATSALGKYMYELKNTWTERSVELDAVYVAMLGNIEGWTGAFNELDARGSRLGTTLGQLTGVVAEMQRRAGVASRKSLPYNHSSRPSTSSRPRTAHSQNHSRQSPETNTLRSHTSISSTNLSKPLPSVPNAVNPVRQHSRTAIKAENPPRNRSAEILREQERFRERERQIDQKIEQKIEKRREREKAPQKAPKRKTSIAERVRSVTKLRTGSSESGKTKSRKTSEVKPVVAPVGPISPPLDTSHQDTLSSRMPNGHSKEQDSQKSFDSQLSELPAEDISRDKTRKSGSFRKSAFPVNLGFKVRGKGHDPGQPRAKSLRMFRRTTQTSPLPDAVIAPQSAEIDNFSPDPIEPYYPPRRESDAPSYLSASVAPPRRRSPDPGIPSPPSFPPQHEDRRSDDASALPSVVATATRARSVKASLRVTTGSADSDPEKTPRGVSLPNTEVGKTTARLNSVPHSPQSPRSPLFQNPFQPKELRPRGPGAGLEGARSLGLDTSDSARLTVIRVEDDVKTPTGPVKSSAMVPVPSARNSKLSELEDTSEPGTPLTSARIQSFSDFYKMPPPTAPASPPMATPEGSVIDEIMNEPTSVQEKRNPRNDREAIKGKGKTEEIIHPQGGDPVPEQSAYAAQVTRTLTNGEKKRDQPKGLVIRGKPDSREPRRPSENVEPATSAPSHSPVHDRKASDASALSAMGKFSTTASLPPRQSTEAPAPQVADGRGRATPDSALAGATDADMKAKAGNADGIWKKIFAGAPASPAAAGKENENPMAATANAGGAVAGGIPATNGTSEKTAGPPDEKVQMGANLLGGEGNDMLWYKGMGKDGLWVSGT